MEEYIISYRLGDGQEVVARLFDINDRDGLLISLDMYKINLGPITQEVWQRFVKQFQGEALTKE